MKKNYIYIALLLATTAFSAFAALVDADGNPATNEMALADIDMAQGTLGDLKQEIAPDYDTIREKATNAVNDTIDAIASDVQQVDLISQYGIASAKSNELTQMAFSGNLLTNKFVIAYDDGWKWRVYSADSEDLIATGEIDDFQPFEHSTTIELPEPAATIYETPSITFQTAYSSKSSTGVVRDKDLTQIVYDDETDWMSLYFKNGVSRAYPNSNQVDKIATSIAMKLRPTKASDLTNDVGYVDKNVTNGLASASSVPTKTSQLENDSGFATTQQVHTAVSNLDYKIAIDTNVVRRTDQNFSIGNGNSLGLFSAALGSNNSIGNRSFAFGFNNRLLGTSQGSAQQYAFGFGNRSQAPNNFIVGTGSGATLDGENSITLGTMSVSTNSGAFVWNWYPTDYSSIEADQIFDLFPKYFSHGPGTFNINPIGGLRGFWIGETNIEQHINNVVIPPVTRAIVQTAMQVEETVMSNVTATAFQGYGWPFGQWTYTPSELALSLPVFTNNLWRYTETNEYGEVVGTAKWVESPDGEEAIQLADVLNGTNVVFQRTAAEVHTNVNGFATVSNLSQYVKHTQLDKQLKGFVTNEKLDNYDASYGMVEGLSTQNQTIQLVMYTNSVATPLQILIPSSGRCKDWIVYVLSNVDLPIQLPPARYWLKNESVTNAVTAGIPTALYFSQVSAEGVYTVGRQEYEAPITIQAPTLMATKINVMDSILSAGKNKKKALRSGRISK